MITKEQLELELSQRWDRFTPKERRKVFRFGNIILVYRQWSELDEREKSMVINAARVIGQFS